MSIPNEPPPVYQTIDDENIEKDKQKILKIEEEINNIKISNIVLTFEVIKNIKILGADLSSAKNLLVDDISKKFINENRQKIRVLIIDSIIDNENIKISSSGESGKFVLKIAKNINILSLFEVISREDDEFMRFFPYLSKNEIIFSPEKMKLIQNDPNSLIRQSSSGKKS